MIHVGAFNRLSRKNPVLTHQELCPQCKLSIIDDDIISQNYYLCEECGKLWHEDCAIEIFEREKISELYVCHCPDPACRGTWRDTNFETKMLKRRNAELEIAILTRKDEDEKFRADVMKQLNKVTKDVRKMMRALTEG